MKISTSLFTAVRRQLADCCHFPHKNCLLALAFIISGLSPAFSQDYPKIPAETLLQKLQLPSGKLSVVIDTDTYNEIDDQFAVVYALLSPEKMDVKAIYAAPFLNQRSTVPEMA